MLRRTTIAPLGILVALAFSARGDIITDWNANIRLAIQTDGVLNTPALANPGWSTRTIAMMNGAMYDAFQSVNRTHTPLMYSTLTPGANREAAAAQAAYKVILDCYPLRNDVLASKLSDSLAAIPDSPAKTAGITLGNAIAQKYHDERLNDGASITQPYSAPSGPGYWVPDPYSPGQVAWGPQYGAVPTFMVHDSLNGPTAHDMISALPQPPAMNSPEYAAAYNEVLNYGARTVYGTADTPTSRTDDQTKIGIFWAYDRASMGPPPVLFVKSMEDIATAVGNTPEQNARMFAQASVAMADAAIASWDAKFSTNVWRPVSGILNGDLDDNAATTKDADWRPLGAPGADPNGFTDDFTPPFPSWTSGHSTMGSALFKSIENFYGTNDFGIADAANGADAVSASYALTSQEAGGGGSRSFSSFIQTGALGPGLENSPEGENYMSRIYLGVHWVFDQEGGRILGREIADYVNSNAFQAVPEPCSVVLAFGTLAALLTVRRRS